MDSQLIKEYQEIKDKILKIEADKIKAQTELELKETELANVINQLSELGIKDLDNLDKIVDEKKQAFELKLKELKEVLDNVSRA